MPQLPVASARGRSTVWCKLTRASPCRRRASSRDALRHLVNVTLVFLLFYHDYRYVPHQPNPHRTRAFQSPPFLWRLILPPPACPPSCDSYPSLHPSYAPHNSSLRAKHQPLGEGRNEGDERANRESVCAGGEQRGSEGGSEGDDRARARVHSAACVLRHALGRDGQTCGRRRPRRALWSGCAR
jgi:hypothetical protein